jgi:fatty-acyl-CoA synthase
LATETPRFEVPLTVSAQLEARANHPDIADRVAIMQHDRSWTYRQFRDEAVRTAHFLLQRMGRVDEQSPGHVSMLLENHLELLSLYAGCAYGGLTLFGINTGMRGDTLSGLLNQSRSRVLVVDEKLWPEVERVQRDLKSLAPENVLVLPSLGGEIPSESNYLERISEEVGPEGRSLEAPDVNVEPSDNLMIIYTSGTTGLPKGINNNHMKLCATGIGVSANLGLDIDDVGYANMPLFHSNAMFVGFMPAFWVCGAIGLRERFSASNFVPDVLKYGTTYWNYVGEPVHYVLSAIRREYGGDEERIAAEVTNHPKNRMRYAVGTGASPPDIDGLMKWMGLEDVFELYGSTEAAISTFRRKGDPRGSVGEVTDEAVKILDEDGKECPPADLDADGKIRNYAEAVGEICRVSQETGLFQGYFDNADADDEKVRDGVYHSSDLGHIVIRNDKRYLFFDGRTGDWIRKDGENFSALQVARLLQEHPDVVLAAAYGCPCSVSDELVMVALKLREGARFDPQTFFDFCEHEIEHGSMDRKWFPDFVRIVDEFEYTQTEKILVRNLKKVHFDVGRVSDEIYWRRRGDTEYQRFTEGDYAALREEFAEAEKLDLLDL